MPILQSGPEKKVKRTIIFQPFAVASHGFQLNARKLTRNTKNGQFSIF